MLAGYWPQATEEGEFATKLNSLSKVVVSSTLESVLWGKWEGAEIIKNNVAEEIAKLKQQPGKDIVLWGSLTLARSLMQAGLIDEVQHYEGATLVAGAVEIGTRLSSSAIPKAMAGGGAGAPGPRLTR